MPEPTPPTTEAEAALLALGPQLEWTRWNEGVIPGEVLYSYRVDRRGNPHYGGEYYRALFWKVRTGALDASDSFDAKTLAEAKAACEHHHATGKWG